MANNRRKYLLSCDSIFKIFCCTNIISVLNFPSFEKLCYNAKLTITITAGVYSKSFVALDCKMRVTPYQKARAQLQYVINHIIADPYPENLPRLMPIFSANTNFSEYLHLKYKKKYVLGLINSKVCISESLTLNYLYFTQLLPYFVLQKQQQYVLNSELPPLLIQQNRTTSALVESGKFVPEDETLKFACKIV